MSRALLASVGLSAAAHVAAFPWAASPGIPRPRPGPCRFIRFSRGAYFDILREKLRWGANPPR